MPLDSRWRDALRIVSVVLAIVAAVIYVAQTIRSGPASSALVVPDKQKTDDGHRRQGPTARQHRERKANGAKFVPCLMAMDPVSIATSFYPVTLLVFNAAVSIMLLLRRRAVG